MTENPETTTPPAIPPAPTPAPVQRPPLRRSTSDRVLAGVSGGIGEWLGIDPVIVRIVLVVLAIFGGSGLVLYGIGWLFIPEAGTSTSEAEKFIAKGERPGSGLRTALIVAAAIIAAMAALNLLSLSNGLWLAGGGGSLLLLLIVGGLAYWLVTRDKSAPQAAAQAGVIQAPLMQTTAPDVSAAVAPTAATVAAPEQVTTELPTGFAYGGYGQYPGYVASAPVPPAPRRPRSYLGLAILSVALVVMGVLASLSLSGVAYIPAVVVLACGMGVLGLGMLIGAVAGRAKWLMWIAIPLLMITATVSVIPANLHISRTTTVGTRNWAPINSTEASAPHSLTIGDAALDLTTLALAPGTTTPIKADVGIGTLIVTAPPGMRVNVTATSGLGTVRVEGLPNRDGSNVTVVGELAGVVSPDAPTVELNVQAGLGDVEVHRA